MKKAWILRNLGILTMVLAFGMAVIGCDSDSNNNGEDDSEGIPKKITITGLTNGLEGDEFGLINNEGRFEIAGFLNINEPDGYFKVSNNSNSVTFNLYWLDWNHDYSDASIGKPYTGSGSFYMGFELRKSNNYSSVCVYTDGQSLTTLGIASFADFQKLPKITLSDNVTTVSFDKFREIP